MLLLDYIFRLSINTVRKLGGEMVSDLNFNLTIVFNDSTLDVDSKKKKYRDS